MVPLLLIVSPPVPPMLCVTAGLFCSVQVPALFIVLLPFGSSVPPVQFTVPLLASVRPAISSVPLIANVAVGATTVVPPPAIVPPVQLEEPVSVTVPVPESVPLESTSDVAVSGALAFSVPPDTVSVELTFDAPSIDSVPPEIVTGSLAETRPAACVPAVTETVGLKTPRLMKTCWPATGTPRLQFAAPDQSPFVLTIQAFTGVKLMPRWR